MVARTIAVASVVIVAGLWLAWPAVAQADEPTTQPAELVAPTTQPAEAHLPPSVTGAGPSVGSMAAPEAAPEALPPTPGGDPGESKVQGSPPPVPTGSEVMRMLDTPDPGVKGNAPPSSEVPDIAGEPGAAKDTGLLPSGGGPSRTLDAKESSPNAVQRVIPEGTIIVDRVGILKSDHGRWIITFQSDEAGMGDPPLILLPNSLLEAMQKQSDYGRRDVRFRVSGVVTQYQRANYLFLRKVLIERNLDRF
ncbi:MAG: hypothetical protein BIFFINMI_02488 [Phycisphaerae bacterium]|nr:hypothetical protein [Phycisphaerae bacterium]